VAPVLSAVMVVPVAPGPTGGPTAVPQETVAPMVVPTAEPAVVAMVVPMAEPAVVATAEPMAEPAVVATVVPMAVPAPDL
jgi:hypothetical protein